MKNDKKIIKETLLLMMQDDLQQGRSFEVAYRRAERRFHKNNISRIKEYNKSIERGFKIGINGCKIPWIYKNEKMNIVCHHCGYPEAKIIYTPNYVHYASATCDFCASHVKWISKP